MSKTFKPITVETKRGTTREALVGMGDVLDRLTDLARAAGDVSPAWSELGDLWEQRQNDVFATDGFGSWGQFALSTMAAHESPLVDEAVMRRGMTSARPRYSDKHMVVFGAPKGDKRVSSIATLNSVGHADRGGTQVPARVVVPKLRPHERRRWLEVIEHHIAEAAG